ncbi:hypothetical protein Y032_0044g917 [Ancylostoma ceylanicum]|uniref:LIM zinc-binding domain-containing protein n=1 Tax=Ancylostoma ceylanicum TaxID=53326 RepID=A0A016UEG6_9BILA|nr:hypothetical protein Y032_0044g917 [Ancylostoma ceylanicum]
MDRSADRRLCGQCHTSIGDEAVVAMNRLWHPDHFTCTACKRPIKQTYQAADSHAYCVHCFAQKYNPKCAGQLQIAIDTCELPVNLNTLVILPNRFSVVIILTISV